jgi:bacterioferritin (cytochrome b1)
MNDDTQSCIDSCNKLLRGELSAVETYTQAIEKFSGSRESEVLAGLRSEHQHSVAELSKHVSAMGGTPDSDSGPWGTFAVAVEGTATMLGESAALTALIEGEKHGINEYNDALADPEVMEEAKDSIRDSLLPRLFDHVAVLEGLRAA